MVHAASHPSSSHRSILDRLLALVSVVREGEGLSAVLLAVNVFLLLGTYYVLKTVREPLILNHPQGAEIKSYSSAGQALLFLLVVPLYGMIASRVDRMKLVGGVTLFFVTNLVLFYVLGQAGVGIGVVFFLWVGIFNMLVVAQFWGFANDLYTEEQGKRLFPVIGVGASLGAWVGSVTAKNVYRALGPYNLMLASGAALCVCTALTLMVHRREAGRATKEKSLEATQPLDRVGGFQLVMRNRYLLGIAVLVFLLNCVNTTGEYILGKFVTTSAQMLPAAERGAFIGEFYGDFFSWVNLAGFLIQMLLVSRIFKWIGVRGALFVLPCIALGGYGILALFPVLAIVKVAKIMENSTDYSLNNTVRHALFLPTSREAKYKAKAATDTFFVRAGDMTQAAIVYAGTQLSFTVGNFAVVNIVMVCLWLAVAGFVYQQHRRLSA